MCYTESLFLLIVLLAMYGMRRTWHPLIVALIIGFSTATRSAGVVVIPVFIWWIWERQKTFAAIAGADHASSNTSRNSSRTVLLTFSLLPITVWGLIAYMGFLWFRFGDPLVFMQTQVHWNERLITGPIDNAIQLVTLEPFFAVYDPECKCYWARVPLHDTPLFNLKFMNPLVIVLTIGLLILGACKRWLNSHELLLSVGLLGIALWFQGARACMMSQARYSSVIFPVYLVMGQILHRIPGPVAAVLCSGSAVLLAFWTALFVSWHYFY